MAPKSVPAWYSKMMRKTGVVARKSPTAVIVNVKDKYYKNLQTLKFQLAPGSSVKTKESSLSHFGRDAYVEVARRLGAGVPFVLEKTSTASAKAKSKWNADEVAWHIRPGSLGPPVMLCPMRAIPPFSTVRLIARVLPDSKTTKQQHWFRGRWWSKGKGGSKCPSRP